MIATAAVALLFVAQAPPTKPSDIRVIRAEVGPKGAPNGDTFIFEEQRDVFDLGGDQQVIVAFEWDGPPGTHHCELHWIAPDGTSALQTVIDLPARGRRFSGYWSLLLNPAMPRGLWAAEAKVDGRPAGSRTFRVQGPPLARPLPPDEMYALVTAAALSLEARLPPGADRRVFSGFAIADDAVITTFGAINGASKIEVTFADGTQAETDEVWLYSRDLDWALLKVPVPTGQARLKNAEQAAKVGDRCAFLNIVEAQRELATCSVLGLNSAAAVPRLSISNRPASAAYGGPLLNMLGETIGMVGVDSQGSGASFDDTAFSGGYRVGTVGSPQTLLALPVSGINRPLQGGEWTKLSELRARGLFSKPVTAGRHVGYGFLSAGASGPRGEGVRAATGFEFYAKDSIVTALVQWRAREKLETTVNHALYDAKNHLLVEGKPIKATLRPGVIVDSSSQIDVSRLPVGVYRLDILLGDEVAWRSYFSIKP